MQKIKSYYETYANKMNLFDEQTWKLKHLSILLAQVPEILLNKLEPHLLMIRFSVTNLNED